MQYKSKIISCLLVICLLFSSLYIDRMPVSAAGKIRVTVSKKKKCCLFANKIPGSFINGYTDDRTVWHTDRRAIYSPGFITVRESCTGYSRCFGTVLDRHNEKHHAEIAVI